ncbi:hypothetical protein C0073_018870 [Aeromonas veronii]|nr:hypothetical protein C0073_018870 [Aeromonas veronii]
MRNDGFTAFNLAVSGVAPGIAVLKTLMSQHHLGVADLPELGSKWGNRRIRKKSYAKLTVFS